jgi:hypothetical protein
MRRPFTQKIFQTLRKSICAIFFALAAMSAHAKPAPSHSVSVSVTNRCPAQITYHIDNNWGSAYTGNYAIAPGVPQKYIFSSNNDEEYYTISYRGAVCVINYPLIRDRWSLDAVITGCNLPVPKCTLV